MNYLIETEVPELYRNWSLAQMIGADNLEEIKTKITQYINDPNVEQEGHNLYLYSLENGSGKTSIAYYILNEIHKPRLIKKEKGIDCLSQINITSIVAVKFANYLKLCSDYFNQDSKNSKRMVEQAPFLLLDDVSPWANSSNLSIDKKEFILLMMYRREHLLPTIVTSNVVPDKFEEMYGATATSKVLENFSYLKIDNGDVRSIIYPGIFETENK